MYLLALEGKLPAAQVPPDLREDLEMSECLERWGWGWWRFHEEPEPYRRRMLKIARIRDSLKNKPPEGA
jgi:hypothetical protein